MPAPKLYYTTTSCGVASYIAAKLGGIVFDSELVDIGAGKTASGAAFEAVNWKGNVPTLVLPDGSVLSENVSCLTWISDNAVNQWGPAQGSAAWFEMVDNLGYVNKAIHGALFKNLFYAPSEEAKVPLRAQLATELGWFVKFALKGTKFLGSQFTVADVYLYICLSWAPYVGVTLSDDVTAYFKGIEAIDGVGSVHAALNTPAPKPLQLATPFTIGKDKIVLKNRVGLSPLTRGRADPLTNVVRDIHVDYYAQRASGGFIITEATGISRSGLGWWGAPGIFNADQVEGWKNVTKAVHAANGAIICQLWHMGRQGHSDVLGCQPISASAIGLEGEVTARAGEKKPYEVPRAADEAEIPTIAEDYAKASVLAMEAGFDGVQIHAANGYLVDQFIQTGSNKRTDKYGGSLENRLRFMREVIEAILAKGIPSERVWIRFAPNGAYGGMGAADNVETFNEAIRIAASYKLGCIEVLDGLAFGFHEKCAPFTVAMVRAATLLGNPAGTTAVMGNCGYTKETGEAAIVAGSADLISYGRPYMSNPDLPDRFFANLPLADPPAYPDWWTKTDADGYTTFPNADGTVRKFAN